MTESSNTAPHEQFLISKLVEKTRLPRREPFDLEAAFIEFMNRPVAWRVIFRDGQARD